LEAFTLVELLVVIGIIGLLAGLIMPSLLRGRQSQYKVETRTIVDKLAAAIESYAAVFGDYPPTSLKLDGYHTNGYNDGIEAVAACLGTRDSGFDWEPDKAEHLGNTDRDEIPRSWDNNWRYGNYKAREVVDAWGNPLVYVRGSDFDRLKKKMLRIKRADGKVVRVKLPKADPLTGTRPGSGTFIIWSFGPDGKDDQGDGDDIASWKQR
jgi:prepilin-type N-terminal cleavage/methylation domain-containing protein